MRPVTYFIIFLSLLLLSVKAESNSTMVSDVIRKNECTGSHAAQPSDDVAGFFNEGVLQPVIRIHEHAPVTTRFSSSETKFIANNFLKSKPVTTQILFYSGSGITIIHFSPIYIAIRVLLI